MKAKEFLEQVRKLNVLIENKLAEIAQWKAIATSATAGGTDVVIDGKVHQMDQVQSSGSQQKMADAVIHYVDLEAEINADIDKLIDSKKDILNVIEQLEAEKYDLLHKVYVQGFTLDEVALKYGFSYSWATTLHGRALKDVQSILDERGSDNE